MSLAERNVAYSEANILTYINYLSLYSLSNVCKMIALITGTNCYVLWHYGLCKMNMTSDVMAES
jgi:hypothetical protein